jgi:hypothetical protein
MGGPQRLQLTPGGNPSSGKSEKLWLTAFLKQRMDFIDQFLKEHPDNEKWRNNWVNQVKTLQGKVDKLQ